MISSAVAVSPSLQHDERLHALAGPFVGDADHGGLRDLRVAVEDVLDLVRVHVEPGDDDHVLQPVDDRKYPSSSMIATSPVWSQPLRIMSRGLLGPVPVAEHHLRSPDAELAALARPPPRGPDPPGRRSCSRCRGSACRSCPACGAVERVRVRHRRAFGEPVALDELRAARDLVEPLGDGGRQRRRARDAGLHRLQVVLRRLRATRSARCTGAGTPGKNVGFSFAICFSTMCRSNRGRHRDRACRPASIAKFIATIPNEWKNGSTHSTPSLPRVEVRDHRRRLHGVRHDVVVREHRALGEPRRAARVDEPGRRRSPGRPRRPAARAGVAIRSRHQRDRRVLGNRRPRLALLFVLLLELATAPAASCGNGM